MGVIPSKVVLQKVESVPPLSAAVAKLCELIQKPDVDGNEIVDVISKDVALTGKLLGMANSAYYGHSQEVGTAREALLIMGLTDIRNKALSTSVLEMKIGDPTKGGPLTQMELWRHSIAAATIATEVARLLRCDEPEEAFVGGLLHDVGRLIFIGFFSETYSTVLQKAATDAKPIQVLEQEAFGISGPDVARALGRRWQIPTELMNMVSRYANPLTAQSLGTNEGRLVASVRVGDHLARLMGVGSDGNPYLELDFLHVVHRDWLSSEDLQQLLVDSPEQIRMLEMSLGLAATESERPQPATSSNIAGVLIENSQVRSVVELALRALGCRLAPVNEASVAQLAFGLVVVDEQASPAIAETLAQRNIVTLNVSAWCREQAGGDPPSRLSASHLREWLSPKPAAAPAAAN